MHKNLSKKELLINKFTQVRNRTNLLVEKLTHEDMNIQTAQFVSPTKWHLAHTTWFFEKIILKNFSKKYFNYDKNFDYLFNSYYNSIGKQHPRHKRGLISRPSVEEIFRYRDDIDCKILNLISNANQLNNRFIFSFNVAINHEQQHQELILMDIQHVFFSNPIKPTYLERKNNKKNLNKIKKVPKYKRVNSKVCFIGSENEEFCFDNEKPKFEKEILPFKISQNTITNYEWKEFMYDDGYKRSELWLSDGFDFIQKNEISKPFYWIDENYHFTLRGTQKICETLPVTNISFYEANAFAKWKKKRLPTEFEIESLLKNSNIKGNFQESGNFEPSENDDSSDIKNLYGNTWEWTSSHYLPYESYKPWNEHLSEYNSKFMFNQLVLKGGSCLTPISHIRASYRNFFYPTDRWVCNSFRLAESIEK